MFREPRIMTSQPTLSWQRVLQRAKLACGRIVKAARAQRRELACIPEPEVGRWRRLVQRIRKGIQSASDSDISKYKRSLFAQVPHSI